MNFELLVSAARIELEESQSANDLRGPYREFLEMEGVVFPSPEVERTVQLWDAQAALDRGAPALAEDGSEIDVSGFDREAAEDVLSDSEEQLINAEKLGTLAELGFISKAASLFVQRTIANDGREEAVAKARNIADGYKNFVQLSMATARWEQPWQDIVTNGFEGPSLAFPLDGEGVLKGLQVVNHTLFASMTFHFSEVFSLRHNLFVALTGREECAAANEKQLRALAQLGIFYSHSPEGCEAIMERLIAHGHLPYGVRWLPVLRHAWADASKKV